MTDILIRDMPDEVLAAIDAKAKRVGLSRSAYLRRPWSASTYRTRSRSLLVTSSASRGLQPTSMIPA